MSSFRGRVAKKVIDAGSRSEREAVVLQTEDQGDLTMRRTEGNPFSDPVLDELVGTDVELEGDVYRGQLFVTEVRTTTT
jgi:hypothetical protein